MHTAYSIYSTHYSLCRYTRNTLKHIIYKKLFLSSIALTLSYVEVLP
jgi:hypothetical protein